MMAQALGRGRHGGSALEQERYYANMSEMWAFHHFTPSLLSDEKEVGRSKTLILAHEFDAQIADTLESTGEPFLGIMWADSTDGAYRSPKFDNAVFCLTLLLSSLRREGLSQAIDLFEVGAGYGSLPRMLSSAKQALAELARPIHVRRYTVLDVRFVIDLQLWYLNQTCRDQIVLRDWAESPHVAPFLGSGLLDPAKLWPELGRNASATGPLEVDFVEPGVRDAFAHLYSEAHAQEAGSREGVPATRALIAINSWHELQFPEYLWYYNQFVAAPAWRAGVDWILYVSNRYWDTERRLELLLKPRPNYHFKVHYEHCNDSTCWRVLRRTL
ncbi:unnamed protein product [Polarella glacialis]|uniref:Uncharacterized protein n=1 Tax=Polarella glacialis TaxID=89957 RepID=A0A813F300_POLGL|nr:unnamed protein product [Polarella glacialis]